ncbi:MAG: hypothetical protein K2M87_08390 [Muribaculaceae bacterium]|nr:hypothetical protein [Muribaculaceae bacterium]
MKQKLYIGKAIASFLLVLLTMPLGHAAMILMEHSMTAGVLHVSAFLLGLLGFFIVIAGVFIKGDLRQTLCGLFGGLLFWTGWVEFLFQYYVDRFGMLPFEDPVSGKVTQPEYLVLPASFGFLMMFFLIYTFSTRTGCNFFNWIQCKLLGKHRGEVVARPMTRHVSIVTFMELCLIMWTSYIVLMFCYDTNFLGDTHPVTIALGLICLVSSALIFIRQTRISSWGANIRMSIATVIVLWTFVEILGHIGLLNEIWLAPMAHLPEMLTLLALFIALIGYTIIKTFRT